MRVIVHDFSGHPFQVHLSRLLASRGHDVLHLYCPDYQTGKGALERSDRDPKSFEVEPVTMGKAWDRYSWLRRVRQEREYGAAFARRAEPFEPDVVLSCNDPLFAKAKAAQWCRKTSTPWVFWLQDVYSLAMADHAVRKLGPAGRPMASWFQSIERRLLRDATSVVAITDDFGPILREWGIDECTVIENWGPRDEIATFPRDNTWARAHGLQDNRVLLYSGTLGLKHDPALLLRLAEACRDRAPDARVVVVSEGLGGDWLATRRDELGLTNLVIEPYQPYEQLPAVLATADVLLTLLEPDAGIFSVPSKILTYLCAGRPILAAMPEENLGARTLVRSGAGVVVDPADEQAFVDEALQLLDDADRRARLGRAARQYAETAFDPATIADAFESVLESAANGERRPTRISTR